MFALPRPQKHGIHPRVRYSDLRDRWAAGDLAHGLRQRLDSMQVLQPGWDTYRAPAPTSASLATARAALLRLTSEFGIDDSEAPRMNLGPSHDGGVTMEWSRGNKTLLVTFDREGAILVARSDEDDEAGDRRVDEQGLVEDVRWLLA
jgi:hypothetical protein